MKAIETVYKGYRFRSRLEARWAVFFDTLGVDWEYEKEGFESEDGTRYLPDFYLPGINWFVEIKGKKPTSDELKKIRLFDNNPPEYALGVTICIGVPEPCCYIENEEGYGEWQGNTWFLRQWLKVDIDKIRLAVYAARQARFEFGESKC